MELPARKKQFLNAVLNRIPFFRLKNNRVAVVTDIHRNENIRTPTSRCRRSTIRNIKSEEDSPTKPNPSEQKQSRQGLLKKSSLLKR
jgi:hypothetical protein